MYTLHLIVNGNCCTHVLCTRLDIITANINLAVHAVLMPLNSEITFNSFKILKPIDHCIIIIHVLASYRCTCIIQYIHVQYMHRSICDSQRQGHVTIIYKYSIQKCMWRMRENGPEVFGLCMIEYIAYVHTTYITEI